MRRIENFMDEFFRARIFEEQKHQQSRLPFRRKFFAEECRYDSHADTLRRLESERVVDIENGEFDSRVITEQVLRYLGGEKIIRLRYHLQAVGDDLLIRDVQTACFVCDGRGGGECPRCRGKQWL